MYPHENYFKWICVSFVFKVASKMVKTKLFLLVVLTSTLLAGSSVLAVDAEQIDDIRQKALTTRASLTKFETDILAEYIAAAFDELLAAKTHSDIAEVRTGILLRGAPDQPSKYAIAFNSALRKSIKPILKELKGWDPDIRKTLVEINLTILVAQLKSTDLVDCGMLMLQHENITVHYWAVKSMTNQSVIDQLNSRITGNEPLAKQIITALDSILSEKTDPEVLQLITQFAGQIKQTEAKNLLAKVADIRIKTYADWSVKYELMDANLMKFLVDEILAESPTVDKAVFGAKFAQLYSYAIQRYVFGAEVLSEVSRNRLASILAQTELSSISKILGRSQTIIKKGIEKRNLAAIEKERQLLLGTKVRPGRIPQKLGFNYGKNTGGRSITAPKELKPPALPESLEPTTPEL